MTQTKLHEEEGNPKIEREFSEHKKIVLHHGDTYDFLKTIPNDTFKLIITSPPYNIGKIYEQRTDFLSYLKVHESIIKELVRTLRSDGSLCWEVGNYVENGEVFPLDIYYYDLFKDQGLKLRNRIIWYFGHGLHSHRRFSGRYETILWFTKSNKYREL